MQSAGASKKASLASISHHDEGLPTFPLLTHSHVVDRRLRESQSTTAVDASEAEAESYDRRPVLRSLAQQQLSSLYQGYGIFGNCDLDKREGGECWIERTYGSGAEESGWKAYEADDVAYAGGCTIVPSHTTRDRGRTGRIPVRRANFRSR